MCVRAEQRLLKETSAQVNMLCLLPGLGRRRMFFLVFNLVLVEKAGKICVSGDGLC